ncbi:MAG: 2,3-bisphosphoglycerate-independent phosphoglycerate mutase [Promethearchaeota archaeon]
MHGNKENNADLPKRLNGESKLESDVKNKDEKKKNIRKCVVVILDGGADIPNPKYNYKTPYELANKPTLDKLTKEGICGRLYPLGIGKVGGSDTSHMALLGDDPFEKYTGRGPLEVAGVGIDLEEGDVSIRCNYCTIDDNLHVINRTAGYPREGIEVLEEAVNKIKLSNPDVKFTFRNSADYRCVLHFRGKGINAHISDMDPSYHTIITKEDNITNDEEKKTKIILCKPTDDSPEAAEMAKLLNEFFFKSHEVLKDLDYNKERVKKGLPPVNAIMPRGAGSTPNLINFESKFGIKGGIIAGTGLIKGLGRLMGMETPLSIPGATGYIDTDYIAKGKKAIELLQNKGCDFVLIHIEGIDEVGHDKNFEAKVKAIEDASEKLVKYLADNLPENSLLVVTSDHTTSVIKGDHTGDPVPIMIWAKDKMFINDDVDIFSERAALRGGLGNIEGSQFMPLLLVLMGVTKKFGA